MRRDVQEIFRMTPHEKQVMMFSATLSKDIRPICKKFMQDVNTTLHYLLSWDFCSHPYPLLACRYAGACDGGWPYLDGCCCCTSWLASHPLSNTWPYLWSCSLPDVTLVFVLLLQLFSSGFLRHTCFREPDLQGCNDSWVECLFNSAISQCLCNLKKNILSLYKTLLHNLTLFICTKHIKMWQTFIKPSKIYLGMEKISFLQTKRKNNHLKMLNNNQFAVSNAISVKLLPF